MLLYSMSISIDGFVTDRDGGIGWTLPSDEQFAFMTDQVAELGAYLMGRKLYEAMRVWETDPSMCGTELHRRFADIWAALPKVVFSRTPDSVSGNARLATASVAEEVAAALASAHGDVSIGGATLAASGVGLGLVEEFRIFRDPVVVGGGTPHLPPATPPVALELVGTRTFASRVVYECYRRVG